MSEIFCCRCDKAFAMGYNIGFEDFAGKRKCGFICQECYDIAHFSTVDGIHCIGTKEEEEALAAHPKIQDHIPIAEDKRVKHDSFADDCHPFRPFQS